MAENSPISKSKIKGALATLASMLDRDVTLVVYGDIQAVLGARDSKAYQNLLNRIDYTVRFDPRNDNGTAAKLERHIREIAYGARHRLKDDWMTSINDVRMPFRLK